MSDHSMHGAYPLIVGDSHAFFAAQALGFHGTWTDRVDKPLSIEKNNIAVGEYLMVNSSNDCFEIFSNADNITISVNQLILNHFEKNRSKYSCIILSLDGNEHNANFMVCKNTPFDFFDPNIPTFIKGRQLIPRDTIKYFFAKKLQLAIAKAQLLRQIFPSHPFYVLPAPPPIPSDEHILTFPEIFDFKKYSLEPRIFRKKIFNVFLEVQAWIAEAIQGEILMAPEWAIDNDGYLKVEYWNHCTHANTAYYSRLINENLYGSL